MADRGELGGIPAAAAAAGRAGPRRGLRTWHDHRGPGGPGPGRGRDRNRRGRGGTGAGAAGGGAARPGQRPVRDRGRVPAGLSGRDVRRGARAPGAPAPDRPGRGAAGDATGVPSWRPVAARDGDYGGIFWFPAEPGMTEWQSLYRAVARAIGGEPDAGRHMHAWARQAGFTTIQATASAWCYTGPEERAWWGSSWADRLTVSPFGDRAVEHGLATRDDLERLAGAWRHWAESEDAWFAIPHGEILCEA